MLIPYIYWQNYKYVPIFNKLKNYLNNKWLMKSKQFYTVLDSFK